jgi:translation initiation factor IF-1
VRCSDLEDTEGAKLTAKQRSIRETEILNKGLNTPDSVSSFLRFFAVIFGPSVVSRPQMWHNICLKEKGSLASLSKDDLIDMQGTVVAVHSGGLYRVQCDAGHEVLAQLSGRMRRFRIKVVPGDRVTVGVSPYDPVRGIITFRAR